MIFSQHGVLVIDPCASSLLVSQLILKAWEELGFFVVVNHGVPENVIARMEEARSDFSSLPGSEKQRSGPPNPLGYGFKTIGSNGDTGEVEYLILHASSNSLSRSGPRPFGLQIHQCFPYGWLL